MYDSVNGITGKLRNATINFGPPKPTADPPDEETLMEYMFDGECEATDGCMVEPDGTCPHGHVSWLIHYGMI